MRDETVDDCLPALKLVPDWFVTSKMLKKLHDFDLLMMIYSSLMNIFVTAHFSLIKWVFLI